MAAFELKHPVIMKPQMILTILCNVLILLQLYYRYVVAEMSKIYLGI